MPEPFDHCFHKRPGRLMDDFLTGRLFLVLLFFNVSLIATELFAQGGTMPNLIPSKQRNFGIPFEVKPDDSADPPKEIELLVSKDRGVRWHSVGRLGINGKQFAYQAEEDGEHWFAFRTITLSGSVKQSTLGPQLRVLVDATPPQVDVRLKQQTTGQIRVDWKVVEKYLKGGSPQFAVSPKSFEGERVWTPLETDGQNQRTGDSQIEGSFLFWPENGFSEFDFRMIAFDNAGNRTEKIETLKIVPVRREGNQILNDPSDFVTKKEKQQSKPIMESSSMEFGTMRETAQKEKVSEIPEKITEEPVSNDEQKAKTIKPDGPAQFGRLFEETLEASKAQAGEDYDALYVRRPSVSGLPVVPPKPMRMVKQKTAVPKPILPTEKTVVLAEKYQPPPMLGSPTGQELVIENKEKADDPAEDKSDDLSRELLGKLDRFFDGKLTAELEEIEQKAEAKKKTSSQTSQQHSSAIPVLDLVGPVLTDEKRENKVTISPKQNEIPQPVSAPANPQVSQATSVVKTLPPIEEEALQETIKSKTDKPQSVPIPKLPEKPKTNDLDIPQSKSQRTTETQNQQPNDKPGKIVGVSLNTAEKQPQIIVKWNQGGPAWQGVQVDVLRGATLQGPWLPIATNLPNRGEYWWYVSVDDMQPFHLMVRLRTLGGIVGDDATQQSIRLNPTLFQRP